MLGLVKYGLLWASLYRDEEEGQGMVEYGLIVALVAVVAAVGFGVFGGFLNDFISGLEGSFNLGGGGGDTPD